MENPWTMLAIGDSDRERSLQVGEGHREVLGQNAAQGSQREYKVYYY